MASIPLQSTDASLAGQLQSARALEQHRQRRPQALCSGVEALDECFSRVVPGDVVEWGIPHGRNGRLVPLQFLRHRIPPSLWVYHHRGLGVFASSWIGHGVDLQRLFFIAADNPVRELKPVFLEDTFKRIVIDAPRRFSSGDMAFVAQQAREHGQILFLIRHYFLSRNQGNPYASLRVNTWQSGRRSFALQVIKGAGKSRVNLPYHAVAEEHDRYN